MDHVVINKQVYLICQYCSTSEFFDTENDVLEHVKTMHPIKCPKCPLKMFRYESSVRKHFKKFHETETPHFCKSCTLIFTDKDDVENHMENEHNIPKIEEVPKIIQTIPTSKLPEKTIASLTSLESYSQQALSIFQTSSLEKPKVEKLETKSQKITQTASATISTNIPVRCICIICGKNYFESSVALSEHKYKCQDCTIDHSYGLSVSQKFKKMFEFPTFFNWCLILGNHEV